MGVSTNVAVFRRQSDGVSVLPEIAVPSQPVAISSERFMAGLQKQRFAAAAMPSEALAMEMIRRATLWSQCPDIVDKFDDMRRDHRVFLRTGAAELAKRLKTADRVDTNFVDVLGKAGFFQRGADDKGYCLEVKPYTSQIDFACAMISAIKDPGPVHRAFAALETALDDARQDVGKIAAVFALQPMPFGSSVSRRPVNSLIPG
ncbi:MAG: hypothetical protein H6868_01555 [Rhodospirillales bacterium]|nr:hypothetical protein [Rhodospirillales bacterium]